MRTRAWAWAPALAAALALASGCGGSDSEDGGEATAPPRVPERAEQVPDLPPGWTVSANRSQGFSLGAPPGWREGKDCLRGGAKPGTETVLCSPDRLVTLSISADRTNEALELEPRAFALRTLEQLGETSYDGLNPRRLKPFKARYAGGTVSGTGRAAGTGVRQEVAVVVLRREGAANFTAVIAANADRPTEPAIKLAEKSLRTLRSEPPGAG